MSGFIYLGTSEFAVTVLAGLLRRELRPELVITPPDRRRGRGRKTAAAPVAEAAEAEGLEVLRTADVNGEEERAAIAGTGARVAMVCAFGQIIREPLLSEIEMLNVHPSLLPRWRGAAPIERAIMAGDAETGVCIIELEAGLDSGPILARRAEPITADDTYGTLSARLAEIGGELAAETIRGSLAGRLPRTLQAEEGITYAEKIEREERRLDPALEAGALERRIRALAPHIGAYLEFEGEEGRLGVGAARVIEDGGGQPGEIAVKEGELILTCARGALSLERVQPPGGRMMAARDYLLGHTPPVRARTGEG